MQRTKRFTGKVLFKKLLWILALVFIFMNIIAAFHAYKFTHFSEDATVKPKHRSELSGFDKATLALFGVNNPKPANNKTPLQVYTTVTLNSTKNIECWSIKIPNAKGTIVIFHGYNGNKSGMIDKSDEFLKMGYNTLLVDFMGSGGSEGTTTTIGFFEADNVKTCFDFLREHGEKNIYLFGTSMGAVAVLKAIDEFKITPSGIILECPFGTMYKTVCTRFNSIGIPEFPMAGLLVFWGGAQNNFWAFGHNPEEYAKGVTCPTLLLYGEKDERVSRNEINEIYTNLKGQKKLGTYPLSGHENYLNKYKNKWITDVDNFLP